MDKVSGMVDKVGTVVVLFRKLFGALCCVKERAVLAVNLIGRVRIQPPMVRIQLPRVRITE